MGTFMILGAATFDSAAAGNKAASLHRLQQAGFTVPAGFVVPPEVQIEFVGTELEAAVAMLGGYPVAVRSSAQLEDLEGISFAGQYATRLHISDLGALIKAIADCRNSARTPQARAYRSKNGFTECQAGMSVLVQKLVPASLAGVVFSIDPNTGHEEHCVIECCRGLGEKLVSGQTTPTRYVARLTDGCVLERRTGQENVALPDEMVFSICCRALEIQAEFGCPQDIEWAFDQERLWILQSRPVTRIRWRSDVDDFTNANFRDGGVAARVCTPLMYSLYGRAFQQSLQQYFSATRLLPKHASQQSWIGRFYGRPYWNTSIVKKAMCKVPGYDEERFDRELGIQKDYGPSGPVRTPMNLQTMVRALPIAVALQSEFRRQLRLAENYGTRFIAEERIYLRTLQSLEPMTDQAFFAVLVEVLRFHTQTESDYLRTVCNHVNYQAEFNRLLVRIHVATGEPIAPVVLMSGLQDISHMKIERGLLRLVETAKAHGLQSSQWHKNLTEFLAENSFYSDAQLDISAPRWGERPERVTQIVEHILYSGLEPKDAEATAREQFERYANEVRRINAILNRKVWNRLRFERTFRKRLRTARRYASRREEMREYSMRADNVVRLFVLEAGRRLHRQGWLKKQDDVFMLTMDELQAITEQRESSERIVAVTEVRRLQYLGYRCFEAPGELGRAISHQAAADRRPEIDGAHSCKLTGNACSGGKVLGRARVVRTLADCNGLQPGEVLVTRFIDPAWTLIMGLVSGIVTEVGGLLSHGAVIAREYGIPAVLDVARATEFIATGQVIEVDGISGVVKIVEDKVRTAVSA
jgi:phosphohistidine swiveling domain-containing protein